MAKILIFGDSITWGAWDEEGGWVHKLKRDIDKKVIASEFNDYHAVYNLGIPGNTSYDLLKRFEEETTQRIDADEDVLFLFAIGLNDSQFVHAKNNNKVSLDQFSNNVHKLSELAKNYSTNIIFVGLTPVYDAMAKLISWKEGHSYKNEYIKEYDEALEAFCTKEQIAFIQIFDKFYSEDYKNMLIDGLHPNTQGHQLIYELVKEHLHIKNLI